MSAALDEPSALPEVTVSHSMSASAPEVWGAISMPGNLEYAHPFCERNPVTVWPGCGARDEVHYLSGWIYRREFTNWIDGVGYDLRIGAEGEPPSAVSWRIARVDSGGSSLTITIQPRRLEGAVPAWLERPAQLMYVRPLLRRYLSSVVRGFESYIASGRPVMKNQFGRHPWFSEH